MTAARDPQHNAESVAVQHIVLGDIMILHGVLHTLSFCNFCHFCLVQACVALDAGIGQIPVHSLDLGEVAAAALRTDIHRELLMTAVVAVCEREIDALIESLLHCTAHERADGLAVIADGILDILDLAAVAQIPETALEILLFDRSQILGNMAVEAVGYIRTVGNALDDAVFSAELLDLEGRTGSRPAYRRSHTGCRPRA